MSDEKKVRSNEEKMAQNKKEDAEGYPDEDAGVNTSTFQVRGRRNIQGLAKISDDVGVLAEFVPGLTLEQEPE